VARELAHARTHVRDTHIDLERINTHLHKACLVYTWPLGRAKTYSLSKVLECIVSPLLSATLSFSPSHITSRSSASRAPYIYLRPRAPRYGPRIAEQKQCTLSSNRPRCNAVTPGIASREAARKWQFTLDRTPWYERAKCSSASGDALGIITTSSRERDLPRESDLESRRSR